MSELTFEKIRIVSADMLEENCLPDMMNDNYIHAKIRTSENLSKEDTENIGKGMINTLLPYKVQDNYNRARTEKEFSGAVLENEFLKAVFVPQLGGRLWSLYDKKNKKELLYKNDVFQPCNLALRNAWFSGGVEWNIGIKGHNPLTCSPMFAERQFDEKGEVMLKMYEYERIRRVSYGITAKLKDDMLLVNINIENTEDRDKYMYWWSNIAVEETPTTRVIVPTEKSFYCMYDEGAYFLDRTGLPNLNGVDVTYATNLERSRDFFYDIPKDENKWIAAIDGDGYGLLHLSTKELIGRKLFAWGQGNGGRHWNNWLSDCGKNYIEIQAGLLKTQLEHFVMKANSSITFTECYTPFCGNSAKIHGDFTTARNTVKRVADKKIEMLENISFKPLMVEAPAYLGSGWGALQNTVQSVPVSNCDTYSKESMGPEQEDWLQLIKTGNFTDPNPDDTIKSYVSDAFWIEKLNAAPDNWHKYYHLGVLKYRENDLAGAKDCFEKSNAIKENAWSYRNLAQLAKIEGDTARALELMEKAVAIKKDYQPLLVNCAEIMFATKNYEKWIALYNSLDAELKENGRLKMLWATAENNIGNYKTAKDVITEDFIIPDIKEGEFSLSHLWIDIYRNVMKADGISEISDEDVLKKYPLPQSLDFRMH